MHPNLSSPCLYILGGLPGTGKSTLSQSLARHLRAVWLRIDTLEQSLRNQGLAVVADAVNPIAITRNAWRQVAQDGQCPYQELEIICSDAAIHRQRLLQRPDTVPGLARTPWQAVQTRTYEAWPTAYQLDTAHNTPAESLEQLLAHLQAFPIEAI
jgi:predicted kinase